MNYRTLFEIYGETPELIDEYVRELIRGSVVGFEEYNSEAVAKAYLIERYGVDDRVLNETTWTLSHKFMGDLTWMRGLKIDKLGTLTIKGNQVKSLDEMEECDLPNLTRLSLWRNEIETLGKIKFPRLKLLNLNSNKITSFKAFHECDLPSLKEINLFSNPIDIFDGIEELKFPSIDFIHLNGDIIRITEEDRDKYPFLRRWT